MNACLLAVVLAATTPKLAVLQVAAGEGVPASTAAAITEAIVAEVRRQSGADVITQREIASILSLEKQKAMLGCETDACMAELGGALGADRLVAGDIARLGESFLLHLRVVEVGKVRVAAQADRRLRGGTIDDVLDVLPAMVAELFPAAPGQAVSAQPPTAQPPPALVPPTFAVPEPPPPPSPGGASPSASAAPPPIPSAAPVRAPASAWVEEPEQLPRAVRDRLYVLTDGEGLYIALVPFQGIDAPLYAGDGRKMYRQRIVGGGQEGRLAFDRVFWEPRARSGSEAHLQMRAARALLTCGKRQIPLRVVGERATRRIVAEAAFLAPPFRRIPHLLARDDQGSYFFVDAARDPATGGPAERPDYRLAFGRKGALSPVDLADVVSDPDGLVLVTASGRLVQQPGSIEWVSGNGRSPLRPLDVGAAASFVYTELGAYAGARLGTPCDGRL